MKDDRLYLTHIFECINNIEDYTFRGKDEFFESSLIQDAVIRNLEVIGEATKSISKGTKDNYLGIPWKEMAGLRDILIHNYFGVDLKIVWNVVENELPKIRHYLYDLLNKG